MKVLFIFIELRNSKKVFKTHSLTLTLKPKPTKLLFHFTELCCRKRPTNETFSLKEKLKWTLKTPCISLPCDLTLLVVGAKVNYCGFTPHWNIRTVAKNLVWFCSVEVVCLKMSESPQFDVCFSLFFSRKKMKSTLFIAVFFENSCSLTNKIS